MAVARSKQGAASLTLSNVCPLLPKWNRREKAAVVPVKWEFREAWCAGGCKNVAAFRLAAVTGIQVGINQRLE